MLSTELFKTIPIRYLGYGMAVGECLKFVASRDVVNACYVTQSVYCLSHMTCVFATNTDFLMTIKTILWDAFASSLFPTLIAFHVTELTHQYLGELGADKQLRRVASCLVGLSLCLDIQKPIDRMVGDALDVVFEAALAFGAKCMEISTTK